MAYPPYQMKGPALYKSPMHKDVVIDGKTYPEGYTQADVDRLKKQNEDVVRREDLDEAGKKIFDANKAKNAKKKTSKKKKTKEDYLKEGFTPADADRMMKDGATTGTSPAPFLGGVLGKVAKGVGKFAKGMVTGKDGKFGIGDVGRLALGPMGAVAGGAMGAGLFKKGKKPNKKY